MPCLFLYHRQRDITCNMTDNTITQYAVLFTGQKLKKAKTWQDGILKCYSFNAKAVLYDEKNYAIDSLFLKGRPIVKGDEFEFDRNLVTIESILGTVSDPTQYTKDVNRGNVLPESGNSSHSANDPTKNRLRWRPVFSEFKSPARNHTSHNGMGTKRAGTEEEDEEMPPYYVPPPPNPASLVDVGDEMPPYAIMETRKVGDQGGVLAKNEVTFPKRRKIGLTRPNSSEAAQSNGDGGEECGLDEDTLDYGVEMNKNEAQLRARPHPLVPTSTSATTSLTKLQASTANTERPATVAQPKPRNPHKNSTAATHDCTVSLAKSTTPPTSLEFPSVARCDAVSKTNKPPVRMMQIPVRFNTPSQYKDTFTRVIYEHLQVLLMNMAMYYRTMLAKRPRSAEIEGYFRSRRIGFYASCSLSAESRFGAWQAKSNHSGLPATTVAPAIDQTYFLGLGNKEHHSLRYMDRFQKLRLRTGIHLSGKERLLWSLKWRKIGDSRTAKEIMTEGCPVYAIRGVSASAEFMMLDNLTDTLHQTPLLPSIINYTPADRPVSTKQGRFKPPSRLPQKSGCLIVKEEYGLDVGAMIKDVIREFTLNEDQESALRALARSVIVAPGWSDGTSQTTPILLVHGVFGAGKSYLIAVMIIFLQRVAAAVASEKDGGEEVEDRYKIMVTSMTPQEDSQADSSFHGTELKELEYMLENDSLPEKEAKYVQDAIRRFKQSENRGLVARSLVVGTTCMASIFDVFNDIHFPLVILDESSQIAEPMAMVPVARISGERLLLVGDPLQLPPTLATSGSAASAGKGLDKTLFDRAIQCHPRISSISNILFYERRLINGVTMKDRAPLVADLPALCFVDVQGQEQQNPRSKSFNNEAEIKVAVATIRRLLELGVRAADVGVIALYKDQADKIDAALKSLSVGKKRKDGVQGAEKDVIVLSCVRTARTNFIDNPQRVNVALTRAKRHLILLGERKTLESNNMWNRIISQCKGSSDEYTDSHTFMQRLNVLKLAADEPNRPREDTLARDMSSTSSSRAGTTRLQSVRLLSPSAKSHQEVGMDADLEDEMMELDSMALTKKTLAPNGDEGGIVQLTYRRIAKQSISTTVKENVVPRDPVATPSVVATTHTIDESGLDNVSEFDIEKGFSQSISATSRKTQDFLQQKPRDTLLSIYERSMATSNNKTVLHETGNVTTDSSSNSTAWDASLKRSIAQTMTKDERAPIRPSLSIVDAVQQRLRVGAMAGLVEEGMALPAPSKMVREAEQVEDGDGDDDEDDVGCLEF
ncbi:hypothetical protein BC938DRAFT_478851 [Jimgerdemannia flammicorona]|uniref:P-loop containing nucleoside triphosphate hydrolase protein n=1 Tax=Jimgerdemannia flammicorona TaxID=994334 RepID=A0A433QY49_9FUNG|nr:hypothetical protein BC938DRAFT_478851 [Jimgerdemannia flammicorona]